MFRAAREVCAAAAGHVAETQRASQESHGA
jgi:hypothetical protein